jgi:hypothetical protein
MPDGSKFDGVVGLRNAMLAKPRQFASTVTENLLTYSLGRSLEYYDQSAVRAIVKGAEKDSFRFTALILGIVNSTPFQMRARSRQD